MVKKLNEAPMDAVDTMHLAQLSNNLAKVMLLAQQLAQKINEKQESANVQDNRLLQDAMHSFLDFYVQAMHNPAALISSQLKYYGKLAGVWVGAFNAMLSGEIPSGAEPHRDRRFKDEAWSNQAYFYYLKEAYFITNQWLDDLLESYGSHFNSHEIRKIRFFVRQVMEALSPSNFIATNPEILREIVETDAQNLVDGLTNLLADLTESHAILNIPMSNKAGFEVGKNIAATKGSVVFRNDLVEIIEYAPTTETVFAEPVFIISPWINKYYILDLQRHNSFVGWLVDQGHRVYITSWVNPDSALNNKKFEDYLVEGIVQPLEAIHRAHQQPVNIIAYCIAGTLMSAAESYFKYHHIKHYIKSITYLTTLVDFSNAGEIGIFVNEQLVENLKERVALNKPFSGDEMSFIFRSLRSSDLIWSFYVHNYLLGKAPASFDLLFWNQDSTSMPAAMHYFYLKEMYLNNALCKPNAIELCEVPIDIRQNDIPCYILSAREDHIAPWKSTYRATQFYRGDVRFVLSASGHVAGVVNPPSSNKYGHWLISDKTSNYPKNPEQWLKDASFENSSWWLDWHAWCSAGNSQKKVKSCSTVKGLNIVPEPAPGKYVLMK